MTCLKYAEYDNIQERKDEVLAIAMLLPFPFLNSWFRNITIATSKFFFCPHWSMHYMFFLAAQASVLSM